MNSVVMPRVQGINTDTMEITLPDKYGATVTGGMKWNLDFDWVYPKSEAGLSDAEMYEPKKSAAIIGYSLLVQYVICRQ
jgi:hypothetical protein